jgi:predicted transcriptional regulator
MSGIFHFREVRELLVKRTSHFLGMAQISVIVPDDIQELLAEVAKETGRSVSSIASDYIEEGVYKHVEQLNKVEIWRGQIAKRKTKKNVEEKGT